MQLSFICGSLAVSLVGLKHLKERPLLLQIDQQWGKGGLEAGGGG